MLFILADWMQNRDVLVDWPGRRDRAFKPGLSRLKWDVRYAYIVEIIHWRFFRSKRSCFQPHKTWLSYRSVHFIFMGSANIVGDKFSKPAIFDAIQTQLRKKSFFLQMKKSILAQLSKAGEVDQCKQVKGQINFNLRRNVYSSLIHSVT